MALPADDTAWPPLSVAPLYADMVEADVWYQGDGRRLASYYGTRVQRADDRAAAEAVLWSQPQPLDEHERRVHVPLAGDIASTSADLLFAEPPVFTVEADPVAAEGAPATGTRSQRTVTQDRLDELVEDGGLHMRLLEAAELAAALGDGYLALAWDASLVRRPLVVPWSADQAIPTFRYGMLTEVTFWRELSRVGDVVLRLLERHAVEGGDGLIEYRLCEGTSSNLGHRVPFTEHPDAAYLDALTGGTGRQMTGIGLLTATHIPNMRPNRAHRGYHGRSDFAAPVYGLFDSVDRTITSWLRDLRLGAGRVFIPPDFLEDLGPGQGAGFNAATEFYEKLNMPPGSADGGGLTINQFSIRVAEHRESLEAFTVAAVRSCGYSAQTFGQAGDAAVTATEVVARERRSMTTRARKAMYWKPALRRILQALLALDAAVFDTGVEPVMPAVELGPVVATDPESQARTLQLLDAAGAISTWAKVSMLHPEWAEPEVAEEVERIRADTTTEADPWARADAAGNQLDDAQGDDAEEPAAV
ncbi:phage portal protein [Nocardiopsis sp. CT-R113]|uniref:Phage portal protein n=1 Tax=Nocardiopsis codii TaxID=3065942 RepID=A0ABU7KGC7_9ACTN|nr:phage portal protein [Nocardiopsis sp. CT-R113]MEE2041268.1 phage portal protein [Nocardiopsis sp. CT-R113]